MLQVVPFLIEGDDLQLVVAFLHHGLHALNHCVKNRGIGHDGIMGTVADCIDASDFIFL